jgi:DNA repair protein RecN (Recombination protein N)
MATVRASTRIDLPAPVSPVPGEDQDLTAERDRLTHAEKLRQGATVGEMLLYGEDGSAFDKIGKAAAEIEALAGIDSQLHGSCDMLAEARRQIEEVARYLQRYANRVEIDPARLEDVEGRLAELTRLCRKHGGSIEVVLQRQSDIAQELETLDNADVRLDQLDKDIAAAEKGVLALAQQLSTARAEAASRFNTAIEAEVADMDLLGAVFRTQLEPRQEAADGLALGAARLAPTGMDDVEFLWSANRGEPPRQLARIASGGELSRLMLAVKRVLCNRDLVSVYVFDEVDTGLGGKAADSIGRKIQAVAQGHQAITITHLAPIAARADFHLRVRKEARDDRTVSMLEPVAGAERAEEIARMIDGARITKATRQAAKAMLSRAREPAEAARP